MTVFNITLLDIIYFLLLLQYMLNKFNNYQTIKA